MGYQDRVPFADILGKTITGITGMERQSSEVTFVCSDGSEYIMRHLQDCGESVQLEDVAGSVEDLIGSPITQAEEVSSGGENADDLAPPGYKPPQYRDSWTWTFYKLATVKGYVTLRWLGESNGYYGEGVDFERTKGPTLSVQRSPNGETNG